MTRLYPTFVDLIYAAAVVFVGVMLLWLLAGMASGEDLYLRRDASGWTQVPSPTYALGIASTYVRINTSGTPDDPDDPPPGDTITARTTQRARLIDEINISTALGQVWGLWAKAMRESGTTYQTAISGIDALMPSLLTQSRKKEQWAALHATTKGEMQSLPKTAETLDAVSKGFAAAGEAAEINFGKLIECILCFIEAWSSAHEAASLSDGVPLPSVLKTSSIQPAPMTRHAHYASWARENRAPEQLAIEAQYGYGATRGH